MCSPTRAALMTGLNHHSAGMGWLADVDSGYPGYRGDMTLEAATLAEVLRDRGWSTLHVGKWHVNLAASNGPTGPYHNWPTSRGFERAYWFQGHSTDYFKPSELIDGVTPVEAEERDDYFVNDALTDRAIALRADAEGARPRQALLPAALLSGGALAAAGARRAIATPTAARTTPGWDVVRAKRLERQRALGIVPATTQLPPLSPGADAWDTLDATQKRIYARYMEVYAGLITNLDANIGRFLAALDAGGWRENTLIVLFSDNGGSAEGTPTGTPNVFAPAFGRPVPVEEAAKLYDVMGEDGDVPALPDRLGVRLEHAVPALQAVRAPRRRRRSADRRRGRSRIAARGEIRAALRARRRSLPDDPRGRRASSAPTSIAAGASSRSKARASSRPSPTPTAPTRTSQYFELGGQRAYLDGNWRLATRHERGAPFDDDVWELYDLANDPNELVDLAAQHPDKVRGAAAPSGTPTPSSYGVFPLDDRNLVIKLVQDRQRRGVRADWDFVPAARAPRRRTSRRSSAASSHEITVELVRPPGRGDGVLLAHGSKHAGYVLHVRDGRLVYEQSLVPWNERIESRGARCPTARSRCATCRR